VPLEDPKRFRIELMFSNGAAVSPLEVLSLGLLILMILSLPKPALVAVMFLGHSKP